MRSDLHGSLYPSMTFFPTKTRSHHVLTTTNICAVSLQSRSRRSCRNYCSSTAALRQQTEERAQYFISFERGAIFSNRRDHYIDIPHWNVFSPKIWLLQYSSYHLIESFGPYSIFTCVSVPVISLCIIHLFIVLRLPLCMSSRKLSLSFHTQFCTTSFVPLSVCLYLHVSV